MPLTMDSGRATRSSTSTGNPSAAIPASKRLRPMCVSRPELSNNAPAPTLGGLPICSCASGLALRPQSSLNPPRPADPIRRIIGSYPATTARRIMTAPSDLTLFIELNGLRQTAASEAHRHRSGSLIQSSIVGHWPSAPNLGNRITPYLADTLPANADRHMTVGVKIHPCIG